MNFGGFRDGDALQVVAGVEGLPSDFFQLRALREDDQAKTIAEKECT